MRKSKMRDQAIGKKSIKALVLFGACSSGGKKLLSHRAAAFAPSPSCRNHSYNASAIMRARTRRGQGVYLNMIGIKRPRSTDSVASASETSEMHSTDQAAKPKISFGLLPDFMQKDPLLVTKQRWMEETISSDTNSIEEETPSSEEDDGMMMIMSVASITLAIGVVYALASSAPDMVEPNDLKESENVVRDLMREGNVERLGIATRNIVGTVIPQSADEVIAASIGEGIAGVIGAVATFLLGIVLNFKMNMRSSGLESTKSYLDSGLVSEVVADGDYFLTRAAAEPLLEAAGIPVFVASLASVLIATVPYQAVKLTSQKRKNKMEEEILMDMLLEEEKIRQKDMTVVDTVSNSIFGFIQQLNVQQTVQQIADDDAEENAAVDEELDTMQQQAENAPALDYVELFADLTKWLEYDVLITNYRSVLTLPNGQMLSAGWESAIFGLLAALSSQLYTDVLYLYSDFGNPLKREMTINRSLEGWASIYAMKCLSAATLFGVYEAVREPSAALVGQLISGGVEGCVGSKNVDMCMETYLISNPPAATLQADFRAFAVSTTNWADNFSLLVPLNDQESFRSFARGAAVSLYSVVAKFFNI